ncbi:hypothetical protein [Cellulosilyticum ruminicola]|uniref:hypothetical protein n=1 Tax=Cellulosilyticum ruminicola TaxID=425254 RepID=UPI0006D03477|nr:hypothetical protein [Cellulosilyticum ruminicola]
MAHVSLTQKEHQSWSGNGFRELRIKFLDNQTGIIESEGYDTYKFYILETESYDDHSYSRIIYGKSYILRISGLTEWLHKNFDKNHQQD